MITDIPLNPAQANILADIQAQRKLLDEKEGMLVQFVVAGCGCGLDYSLVTEAVFIGTGIRVTTKDKVE